MLRVIVLSFVFLGVFCDNPGHDHVHAPGDSHHHHHHENSSHTDHDHSHVHTDNETGHHHHHSNPQVTPEQLASFHSFSRSLLRQKYYYDSYESSGAVAYCTFTVGLMLAGINEQYFNVRSAGIVKALGLPRENITDAYAAILDSFLEDPAVKPSNNLYSPRSDQYVGENFKKLHLAQNVLLLHGNPPAESYINQQIGVSTKDNIKDNLVPHNPPFNSTANGVFVNTFYYQSNWEIPCVSVGEKSFQTPDGEVQVKTLETTGSFPYFENDYYSAVALPLTGGRKQVIFVRPKKTVQDYLQNCVEDIFKPEADPSTWSKKLLRVQVPQLNLILGRNYESQLNELGETDIGCCGRPDTPDEVIDISTRHYIQPVSQVLSAKLTAEGYELAVANGVQVNKIPHDFIAPTIQPEVKTTGELPELVVHSGKYTRQGHDAGVSDFVVNSPFFVYLRDNALGAVSFTAVRSTFDVVRPDPHNHEARHHITDISTDFSEESKVNRWNCHPKH